jgi:hypothetical protein
MTCNRLERIADAEFESWCEEKAVRIQKIQATAVLEMATHLAEVHQQYLYRRFEGGFRGWVEDRLKISRQTAYSLLNVHKQFGGQSVKNLDTLPRSALCLLAAPSTPEAARTEVVERAKKGEKVSHNQVKRTIDKHKPKRPARACASSSSAPDSEKVAAPVPVPTTVPTTPEQSAEDRQAHYEVTNEEREALIADAQGQRQISNVLRAEVHKLNKELRNAQAKIKRLEAREGPPQRTNAPSTKNVRGVPLMAEVGRWRNTMITVIEQIDEVLKEARLSPAALDRELEAAGSPAE